MKVMLFKLLLIMFVAIPVTAWPDEPKETDVARNQLQKLLDREYHGDACARDDISLASYHPELQEQVDSDIGGACLYLNADTLHLVRNVKIQSVRIENNKGSAIVSFEELGTIKDSLGTRKVTIAAKTVNVKYELRKQEGRWTVYDPPAMRVSVPPIRRYYTSVVTGEEELLLSKKITASQRKVFRANRKILEDLAALAKKVTGWGGPISFPPYATPDQDQQ